MRALHFPRRSPRRGTGFVNAAAWSWAFGLQVLLTSLLMSASARAGRRGDREAGGITAEYVLVTAFVVGIVATVGLILKDRIIAFAQSINFTTP